MFPEQERLLGRTAELAVLETAMAELDNGRGALFAVEGPAGIGKTALLDAAAASALARDIAVVSVRCAEAERFRPFGGLLDTLDCRLNHPDAAHRRVAELLVAGLDSVADPFRLEPETTWRLPVQEALTDLVIEKLDRGPTMLTIDDLQWADAGTGGLLLAIARRVLNAPLLLLWTHRSSFECAPAEELKRRFRGRVNRLALGPLAADALTSLAERILSRALVPGEADLVGAAAGNPLVLTALCAHEAQRRHGDEEPGAGTVESSGVGASGGDAPTGDRQDAIGRWVEQLPVPTGDALVTASVLGVEFDARVLAEIAELPVAETISRLAPALHSGVLRALGGGRYAFAHDLVRARIEADVPRSLLAALHRSIADAIERLGGDEGVVARHLALGARPGDEASAQRIRVACATIVRSDAGAAAALLEAAEALCVPGSSTWADVVADRVTALQWAGRAQESLEMAERAVQHPMPPAVRARVHIVRATSLGLVNDLAGAAAEYRSIVDDPATEPELRSLVLADLATLEAWGVDRARGRETAQRALEVAREAGALQAELQALCALSTMALFDGKVHEAVALARDCVARGRGHKSMAPAREVYLGLALANADQFDEAAIWFRQGQSAAEAVSDLWVVSRYQLARMSWELCAGEWDSVVADAEAVIAMHDDTGIGSGMPQAPASAGIIAVRRGAPDDVVDRYRTLSGEHAKDGAELAGLLVAGWFEGLLAERDRRLGDAVAILEYACDAVVATAPLVQLWLAPDLVRVLLADGEVERATALAERLGKLAGEVVRVPSATGTAALCAGLVDAAKGGPSAIRTLTAAAAELRSARRLPALLQALDALDALGVPQPERRAMRDRLGVLSDHTGETAAGVAPALRRLTQAERGVVALIAEGHSNPAIAARLGISKRTVEYHVSSAYMKLGVNSRVALARLAVPAAGG